MEQKQVLDNLYALRAGLSVISQQYDKSLEIEDECDEQLAKNAESLNGAPVCFGWGIGSKLSNLQERYGYIMHYDEQRKNGVQHNITKEENYELGVKAYNHWLAYDESFQYFRQNLVEAENSKTQTKGGTDNKDYSVIQKIFSSICFIIAGLTGFLVIAVISGMLGSACQNNSFMAIQFVLPITVISLILAIIFICLATGRKKAYKREIQGKDAELRIAATMLQRLPQVRENARAIINEKDKKIAPLVKSSNEFYMALKKQFSYLLDERDWKNLDLVIYELETRRADTVKEALQLVDRELQTERIQQTIVQATEQICYEIRRGFAELRETIVECSRVISAQLSVISLQLGGMSGQLTELCDSVNMANALQEKANVSSRQLLNEIEAIRFYQ
ncbi:MAG: hypothetical protein K2N22_00475 [Clostridia bacterium]|nr:hypothetical protein [Clostridia bacterium]